MSDLGIWCGGRMSAGKTTITRLAWLLVIAGCILVYLKNYWLAEDSYINFRALDQLWEGRGPVWNAGERVQVYTSALWYWLVAASRVLIDDNYLATFACSFVLYLAILEKVTRMQANGLAALLALALLLSSNSFMDFTASGLENVLIFFLLLHFVQLCLRHEAQVRVAPYLLAALLLVARHDNLVLVLPAALALFVKHWRACGFVRTLRAALLGCTPFFLWEIFSVVYYGFPFPNTAYAKLSSGIAHAEMLQQGINYVRMSSIYDPLLPVVLLTGFAVGMMRPATRWLALGLLVNVAYIVYVGGDYMRGRFFSCAYLLAVLLLLANMSMLRERLRNVLQCIVLAALVPYQFSVPFTPITASTDHFDHVKTLETANERGIFYRSTSLFEYVVCKQRHEPFPSWPFYTDGLKLREEKKPWLLMTNIGMMGYAIGLDVHVFDRLALADPLLARLPTSQQGSWTPGHFVRDMPWGYVDANLDGSAPIYDPDLDEYYRQLKLITRSPELFSAERWKAILAMNLSHNRHLLTAHIEGWQLRGCQQCKQGESRSP